jgi:DNA-binding XRE family transcriptional regulator
VPDSPRAVTDSNHPLYRLRIQRGLSRERLAQRAGLSARTIYGIEREGHEPLRSTAVVLALVLGCRPEDLTTPELRERA